MLSCVKMHENDRVFLRKLVMLARGNRRMSGMMRALSTCLQIQKRPM